MRFNLSLLTIAAILLISPPANPFAPEKLGAGYSSSRENESIHLWPGLEHSLLGRQHPRCSNDFRLRAKSSSSAVQRYSSAGRQPLVQFQTGTDRLK
jgi:hypothetical protein